MLRRRWTGNSDSISHVNHLYIDPIRLTFGKSATTEVILEPEDGIRRPSIDVDAYATT